MTMVTKKRKSHDKIKTNKTNGGHRAKQKAETYALILDNAKQMFEEVGYEKTTMRKIAEKAGISHGAIFKHFENKSALLASALFDDIDAVQKRALSIVPESESIQRQFLFIAEQFFNYYAIRPALSKILVEHSLFIKGEWKQKFNAQSMSLIQKIVELIQVAKQKGTIHKDMDSELLASAFFSHYIFVLILTVKEPVIDPASSIQMLEPFINLAVSGANHE